LYLGINKPHKNLSRLLQAYRLLREEMGVETPLLVIAGAWDERYPEVKQQAAATELADSVRFLGPVPEADLPSLYAAATLFVFPSLYEGFGLPVLEAMACGTAVACSRSSSLPEVGGRTAFYFDPRDVAEMAAVIARPLRDKRLRAEREQQGLDQAARFSWQRTADETLAIYRELAP
jgi:glycosyltransferase involved in cell wall biosynthesis